MNLYIGENIRRLRREKDITQEKLAEQLNVSTQAVSKWERGETYPDITLILPLASYFAVSTDELLGLDAAKNEEKIKNYLDEYHRLGAIGKTHEKFELMCDTYKEFPNDFRIIEEYMWQLNYDPNEPSDSQVHKEELYKLCFKVLDECTLDSPRYSALSILSGLYVVDGDVPKSIETCNRFPNHYYFTANEQIENIYDRGTEYWWKQVQLNIRDLAEILMVKIRNCALCDSVSPTEQIRILEKAVAVLQLIYDEGDYGFSNWHMCELYLWIANRYIMLGNPLKGIEYYDSGLSYGKAYDEMPRIYNHTSFLVNRYVQDMTNICSGSEDNSIKSELEWIKSIPVYDIVKDMDEFKAVVAKYEPFAGKKKQYK